LARAALLYDQIEQDSLMMLTTVGRKPFAQLAKAPKSQFENFISGVFSKSFGLQLYYLYILDVQDGNRLCAFDLGAVQ